MRTTTYSGFRSALTMKSRSGTLALALARRAAPRPRVVQLARLSTMAAPRLPRDSVALRSALPSLRMYASEAVETSAVETARVAPPPPPPRPVPGAEMIGAILKETEYLLAHDVGGTAGWYERVQAAQKDLGAVRRARLAVIGDDIAAPHDVVSALLQDPLADTEGSRNAIMSRYFGTSKETLLIALGDEPSRSDGQLTTPSAWMQKSNCDIMEVALGPHAESQLVACDAVAFVLDPVRLATAPCLEKLLPIALGKGYVQFVINGPLPPHTTQDALREALDKQLRNIAVPGRSRGYGVTFIRAEQALTAVDALSRALDGGSGKSLAFDTFQRDFLSSNIGPLQNDLMHLAPAGPQLQTAAATARLALAYTTGVIASDREVLREASNVVSQLRRDSAQGSSKARRLSVVSRGSNSGVIQGSVDASIRDAEHYLKQLFKGRLSWLSILTRLRVDDVSGDVGGYIARAFARDLDSQLVYEAGQLAQLQDQLGKQADRTARTLTAASSERAGHPFSSPVLLNHLSSLALSIPPVASRTLLAPVATRRAQLINTAVPQLQAVAQRALASSATLTLAGVGGAWLASVPPASLISGSTAVGLGALAFVASLALGQAWWAKAQKRFWKDWMRVTHMLKDDLAVNYDHVVDALVLARPNVTADGLQELVNKREARLADLERRIVVLESQVDAVAAGLWVGVGM